MKKYKNDILTNCIQYTIIILFLSTPLILVNEINIGLGALYVFPDFGIRTAKEYALFLLIVFSTLSSLLKKEINTCYKYLPFMLFALLIVLLNSNGIPSNVLMCGFRWVLPIFLPIFLYGFIDDYFLQKCYKALSIVFAIHLISQVLELFVMPAYNGATYFGLTARVPGLFIRSHGAAYFTCLYYLLIIGFEERPKRRFVGTLAVVSSLLLAASSTGIIVFIVSYLLNKLKKSNKIKYFLPLLPIVIVIVFLNADTLTNRKEGSSKSSIGTRIERFDKIFENSSLISENFGYATNGVFTLSKTTKIRVKDEMFADSFYNSLFGNLGILISLFIFVILITWLLFLVRNKEIYALIFLLFYILFAISNIITEVYPGNLFLGIICAYFLKKIKSNALSRSYKQLICHY